MVFQAAQNLQQTPLKVAPLLVGDELGVAPELVEVGVGDIRGEGSHPLEAILLWSPARTHDVHVRLVVLEHGNAYTSTACRSSPAVDVISLELEFVYGWSNAAELKAIGHLLVVSANDVETSLAGSLNGSTRRAETPCTLVGAQQVDNEGCEVLVVDGVSVGNQNKAAQPPQDPGQTVGILQQVIPGSEATCHLLFGHDLAHAVHRGHVKRADMYPIAISSNSRTPVACKIAPLGRVG
jgi:hypothetical protein